MSSIFEQKLGSFLAEVQNMMQGMYSEVYISDTLERLAEEFHRYHDQDPERNDFDSIKLRVIDRVGVEFMGEDETTGREVDNLLKSAVIMKEVKKVDERNDKEGTMGTVLEFKKRI